MERLKFIAKRLLYLVIMLWGVATIVFILTKLIPGGSHRGKFKSAGLK